MTNTVTLAAAGDIMFHSANYIPIKDSKDDSMYDLIFREIAPYLHKADLATANLETSFANREYSDFPRFNAPLPLLKALKNAGFGILTNANNHTLDMGYEGLCETLENLDNYGIIHTGASKNPTERDNVPVTEINNIRIAHLAYTYALNESVMIPAGREYCYNLMSREILLKHIENAKVQGADIICVSMHWGLEYEDYIRGEQTMLAEFMFESGVNIILGSHPHVLQPVKLFANNRFLAYSLGGLYSGMITKELTRLSCILQIRLEKNDSGKTVIRNWNYIPTCLMLDDSKRIYIKDISKGNEFAPERRKIRSIIGR